MPPLRRRSGRCVALNGKILFYLGIWPAQAEDNHLPITLWRLCFPPLQIVQSVYGVFSMIINVCQAAQEGLAENAAAYFCVLMTYTVHLVKICTLYFDSKGVQDIVRSINALQENKSLTGEKGAKALLDENLRNSRRFTMFLTFLVVPFFVCLPLLQQSYEGYLLRKIPFRNWFIVDISQSPKYEVTLAIVTLFAILDNIILTFHDILFLAFIMEVTGQFRILSYTLRNLKALATKELSGRYLETNPHLLRRMDDLRKTLDASKGENKDMIIQALPSQGSSDKSVNAILLPHSLVLRETDNLLKECVKHHVTLLRTCELLESVFQPSLTFLFISNLALGIAVFYVTTLTTEIDSQVMGIIVLVCAGTGEILLFCIFCDSIYAKSISILDDAYACDWFDGSVSFKRTLLVIISRASQPAVIRVLTFLPITMSTFQVMVNSSYSLYRLLTTFTGKEDGMLDKLNV